MGVMHNRLPITVLIGTSDLVIREGRFILFEHVDNSEWIRFCTMMEAERMRQRGCLMKTWWEGVEEDMKSFGLSREDTQI